jgi:hypothetical protein
MKTGIGYFGSRLSDNITQMPNGSIVCHDVTIARTGFQDYKVSELPEERANDLGIDTSNPNAMVRLYRSPEEVFHPDTIHSFEAATVTDNHPPNMEFVTPENFNDLARGHVQNVRKGKDVLDDGEWPLIGDLVVTAEPLISEILKNRKREVSCGYDYSIDRDGDVVLQVSMVGNHVAVVTKGRAGPEARIMDAAPEVATVEEQAAVEPEPQTPASNSTSTSTKNDPPQEKKLMKLTLKSIFGHGLQHAAKDESVDPESLADAALELSKVTRTGTARANDEGAQMDIPPEPKIVQAADRKSDDRRADDSHRSDDRKADDSRRSDDRRADDRKAGDGEPDEERERLHSALDKMMDAKSRRSEDADIAELRKLMDNYLQEEQHEPMHEGEGGGESGDADNPDLIPEEGAEGDDADPDDEDEYDEEDEPEVVHAGDRKRADDVEGYSEGGNFHPIRGSEGYKRTKGGDPRKKRARDTAEFARAADAAAREALRAIKPLIARSGDSALIKAFNAQMRRVSGNSFSTSGNGYARFAGASRARAADAGGGATGGDDITKLQEFYNNRHGKKITAEVK